MKITSITLLLLFILHGNLKAQFETPVLIGTNILLLGQGDVDNDGDTDFYYSTSGFQNLRSFCGWMENNGGEISTFDRWLVVSDLDFVCHDALDMNGDGNLDFLGIRFGSEIGWYVNNNSSTSWEWTTSGLEANSFEPYDYDRDGDIDITIFYSNAQREVFLNDGTGNFDPSSILVNNNFLYTPKYNDVNADIDGDGLADGAKYHCLSSFQGVCISPGIGLILSSLNYGIAGYEYLGEALNPIVVYDLDQSGYADVLFSLQIDNDVQFYLAMDPYINGFNPILQADLNFHPTILVSDFDNDGDFDILSTTMGAGDTSGNTSVSYLVFDQNQLTEGTFSTLNYNPPVYASPVNGFQNHTEAFDLYLDGTIDLFNHSHAINVQNIDGDFEYHKLTGFSVLYDVPSPFGDSADMKIGIDVDGDQIEDLINYGFTEISGSYVTFDNNLEIETVNPLTIEPTETGVYDVLYVDYNNDDLTDIIFSTSTSIVTYMATENGIIPDQEINLNQYSLQLRWEDINLDGNYELLLTSYVDNALELSQFVLYVNNGIFDESPTYLFEYYTSWTFNYLDGDLDGDLDVILPFPGIWWQNDGNGVFTELEILPQSLQLFYSYGIQKEFGDLNGDGILDRVEDNWGSEFEPAQGIVALQGANGTGFTTVHNQYYLHDFNGDGITDILSLFSYADEIFNDNYYVINYGSPYGILIESEELSLSVIPGDVKLAGYADLNNDGLDDIIWTSVINVDSGAFAYEYGLYYCSVNASETAASITGRAFLDYNQDGVWAYGEPEIDGVTILVNDDQVVINANGFYGAYLPLGNYDVSVTYDADIWTLTTNSTYNLTLDEGNPNLQNVNFGFFPASPQPNVELGMIFQSSPCGELQAGVLFMQNTGNIPLDGDLTLNLDELTSFYETTNQQGVTFSSFPIPKWTFNDLLPGATFNVNVLINYPGVENIGESLEHALEFCAVDENSVPIECFELDWQETITCSYDPNDIHVDPKGYLDEGFILNGTPLEYTINFQNTGNDYAYNVEILNQLSENMDVSTFELLEWSHEVFAYVDENKVIHFIFPGIYLTYSDINLMESMGYVRYRILPLPDLDGGTPLPNSAEIYFDNNPAIYTNTVINTIFDCNMMGNLELEDAVICTGSILEFTPDLFYVDEFVWTINGNQVSANSSYVFEATDTGVFDFSLNISNDLCEFDFNSQFTVIEGPSLPIITQDGGTLSVDGVTGNIQWYLNNELIEGATESTIQIEQSGNYHVTVTDECVLSTAPTYFNYTSVYELQGASILGYPNPCADVCYISLPSGFVPADIRINDPLGRELKVPYELQGQQLQLDVSGISKGHYSLRIIDHSSLPLFVQFIKGEL